MNQGLVLMPVSPGELLDRLSILSVKQDKLAGEQMETVRELAQELHKVADQFLDRPGVPTLVERLVEINTQLWEVEDRLRALDRWVFPMLPEGPLGQPAGKDAATYCKLARLVYNLNDQRCGWKRELDEMLGGVVEPKQYTEYE
ncbi:hypothetical protein LCGC14_2503180, partial [marine sediment metagenome]